MPWPAVKDVLTGLRNLTNKILIDASNPLLPDLSGLVLGTTTSAGEQVAEWARGAKVVKAFNIIGSNIMADASFKAELAGPFLLRRRCGREKDRSSTGRGARIRPTGCRSDQTSAPARTIRAVVDLARFPAGLGQGIRVPSTAALSGCCERQPDFHALASADFDLRAKLLSQRPDQSEPERPRVHPVNVGPQADAIIGHHQPR